MNKIMAMFLTVMITVCLASAATGEAAPVWADVTLNESGFLDEGIYIFEDPENGRWMYADRSLRIQVVRTWETPEKIRQDDYNQEFWCYTTEIWCDTEQGELPFTLWADPTRPGDTSTRKTVEQIAKEQGAVFAVSTDLFTQRISQRTEGIVIRNGEVLYDTETGYHPGSRPPFETLAIYEDGHIESAIPKEKRAEEYLAEGAKQVYTFGPVLVRDGEIPEVIARAYDRNLNPMHAFGMIEPGHYIDVLCEGRLKSVNGSTGVNIETMARILRESGCVTAVNLDGGVSASVVFMGVQLNLVPDGSSGRTTCEVLSFGQILPGEPEKEENP